MRANGHSAAALVQSGEGFPVSIHWNSAHQELRFLESTGTGRTVEKEHSFGMRALRVFASDFSERSDQDWTRVPIEEQD
jgi:hypothetical protein